MDYSEVLRQVDSACEDFQVGATRVAAEKMLMQFRDTPNIHAPALYVFQHSTLPFAKHTAAAAVAQSITRANPTPADAADYANQLVSFVVQAGDPTLFWAKGAVLSAATIVKRLYPTQPQLAWTIFSQLVQSANPVDGSIAYLFFKSLLEVFSDRSVGPTPAFHQQCQSHFQSQELVKYLQQIAIEIVQQYHAAQAAPQGLDQVSMHRARLCVELLENVLTWDFRVSATSTEPLPELAPVELPAAFAPIVLDPNFLATLYGWVIFASRSSKGAILTHRAFQSLYALSCSPDLPAGVGPVAETRVAFCTSMVQGMHQLLQALAGQFRGTMLNGISGILRRLNHHFPMDTVLSAVPGFLNFLNDVGRLTVMSIPMYGRSEMERTVLEEANVELIAMWARVGSQTVRLSAEGRIPAALVAQLGQIATQIVHAFVQEKMTPDPKAIESDEEDEDFGVLKDWDTYDEALADIACLARMSPAANATFLAGLVHQVIARVPSLTPDTMVAHYEGTHWLLLITGAFFSDFAENEIALIPAEILAAPDAAGPIRALGEAILGLLQFLSENPAACSPTVMESQWWDVERFVKCYVCPDASEYSDTGAPLLQAFGPATLQFTLARAAVMFDQWSGEADVLLQVSRVLLAISKVRTLRAAVIGLPEFAALVMQFLAKVQGFPDAVYSGVMEALVRIATAAGDRDAAGQQMTGSIIATISGEFSALAQARDLQSPQNMQRLVRVLEMLNGVACAVDIGNMSALAGHVVPFFVAFPQMMASAGGHAELWLPVFDILVHFAEGDVFAFLDESLAQPVFVAMVGLVRGYLSTLPPPPAPGANASLVMDEEQRSILCRIVELLTMLTEERGRPDMLATVLAAWSLVSPYTTSQAALEVPSICIAVAKWTRVLVQIHGAALSESGVAALPLAHFLPAPLSAVDHIWAPLARSWAYMVTACPIVSATTTALDAIAAIDVAAGACPAACADSLLATLLTLGLFHRLNSEHRVPLAHATYALLKGRATGVMAAGQAILGTRSPAEAAAAAPLLERIVALVQAPSADAFVEPFLVWLVDAKAAIPQQ
ncbi:hypothetical protein H9P43_000396 [Blastocladiella emersonii ATCC 22665]|nr:hypothetical protein H9P43_000396 [Blastocladiella emersonii ATCC 22665]